jgi:CubicO group peptidase (beta-lactamase class C family)
MNHPPSWAAALVLLAWNPSPARAAPVDEAAVDGLVRDALRSWGVPGVAVAIVRDDAVVYLKGHGVREAGQEAPVTPDTLFPIGSCSKAFTSAALALLVDLGKADWDDPVRKHLPWFRLSDPLADRAVTLRDLLCHRTGLRGHDLLWYRAPWTPEEAVRRAGLLPLDRPFRSAFQYQNTMMTAAGLAAAAAAGEPWDVLVRKRLFGPLGMTHSACSLREVGDVPDRARPHRTGPQGWPVPIPFWPMDGVDPAGSIQTSARDLCRWLRFHLAEGVLDGRRLVSARSLGETHTPQMNVRLEGLDRELQSETVVQSYGLAWVVYDYRGRHLIGHTGATDGFRAHLTLLPRERIGIAILCNLHHTRLNLALSNALVDLLLDLPRRDWNGRFQALLRRHAAEAAEAERVRQARRRPDAPPSHEPSAYAGAYDHPAYGRVEVALQGRTLLWRWHSFAGPLEHFQDDTFTLLEDQLLRPQVSFRLGPDGSVVSLSVDGELGVEFRRAPR